MAESIPFYVGTYTKRESEGIYRGRLDPARGTVAIEGLAAPAHNASFLATHPSGDHLYAVSEIGNPDGALAAYRIETCGDLVLLNQQPTRGAGPCHVAVDATGRLAFAANYGGGSVVAFPIDDDGALRPSSAFHQHTGSSVNPKRQEGPHAHSVTVGPDNRHVLVADLGLDQVRVYRMDPAAGTLAPHPDEPVVPVDPGQGPRHMAFDPAGERVYLINELGNRLVAFAWDRTTGTLRRLEAVSTLPEGFDGVSHTAHVAVHPTGRFVYGSNRGHDSIAAWRITDQGLELTGITQTGGSEPRHFAVDPSGKWIVAGNQHEDRIVVLAVDPESGALTLTDEAAEVPCPVCIAWGGGE